MEMIKVCQSRYGGTTGIYSYINPNQIVDITIAESQYEINAEALLTNGNRVLFLYNSDLEKILGEENAKEMLEEIEERRKEKYGR